MATILEDLKAVMFDMDMGDLYDKQIVIHANAGVAELQAVGVPDIEVTSETTLDDFTGLERRQKQDVFVWIMNYVALQMAPADYTGQNAQANNNAQMIMRNREGRLRKELGFKAVLNNE